MPIDLLEKKPKDLLAERKPRDLLAKQPRDLLVEKPLKPIDVEQIGQRALLPTLPPFIATQFGARLGTEMAGKRLPINLRPPSEIARPVGQAVTRAVDVYALGLPSFLGRRLGYKIPEPETPTEAIAGGLGSLAGFIGGPLQIAGKIAPRIPFLARAFRPAATMTQAVAKPIIRGAATLGTASAIMTPEGGLLAPAERAREFGSGATTGAVFGGLSFIPSAPLRMLMTSAYVGVPSTLREEPLEQQIFNYGLGAWMGRHGGSPKQILAREKPLSEFIRYGTDSEMFLKDAEKILQQERQMALETGRDPIPRQERFNQLIGGTKRFMPAHPFEINCPIRQRQLAEAKKVKVKEPLGRWKSQTIKGIRRRIIELKRDPQFQLEMGDADFVIDYITKDLGFKTSELAKLNDIQLANIFNYLTEYRPPADSPFIKTPPLKPIFAGRDWRKKINPWDVTLRQGLRKLEKLGFGGVSRYGEEGLTRQFFTSGAEKQQFMFRYMLLRNNWLRTVGMNRQRSNDIFGYLNGETHPDYLKKIHGENTLKVANQMRNFLDTLLIHQNRHKAMYGEEPIKARKNYITHLFEDLQADIIAKKHPFPDWLADAMPYIIPKKKVSPFLKERKGAMGYQRDVWRALDAYVHSASQVIGDEPIRRAYKVSRFLDKQMKYERDTGKVSEVNWQGIKQHLNDYIKDLQGRPGKLDIPLRAIVDPINSILSWLPGKPEIRSLNDVSDGIVSLLYGAQMAYRPKLPIRNLGQHSLIIGQTGYKPLAWAVKNRNTKQAREILKHSKLKASRAQAFGAETQALFGRGAIQRITEIGMRGFRWADMVNVEDGFLAGYKQAIDNPRKWPNPYRRGDEVAALTQYIYLPENRSDLARGFRLSKTLGRPMSLFTTWPSNWVEFNIVSASNPATRMNLLKYWATALAFTGLTAAAGIKGAEYVGISSPQSILQIARGQLPIAGIAEKPRFQAWREWSAFLEGDKTLKELLFYTFRNQ